MLFMLSLTVRLLTRLLVRRKWAHGKERTPGRPPIDPQIAALIVRMARENARWVG